MQSNSIAGIGSRETPKDVLADMKQVGEWCNANGVTLNSGHAEGADWAFERGAQEFCHAFIPWLGFNGQLKSKATLTVPDFTGLHIKTLARMYHPVWDTLTQGVQKLMMRNIYQVLGEDLKSPVRSIVCWTKDGKASGGTGQALRCAYDRGIQVLNFHRHSLEMIIDELRRNVL